MRRLLSLLCFRAIEGIAFLLPAFPPNFVQRISILIVYYLMHLSVIQASYKNAKRRVLS